MTNGQHSSVGIAAVSSGMPLNVLRRGGDLSSFEATATHLEKDNTVS